MNDTNINDNQNSTGQSPQPNNQNTQENQEKRFPLWVSLLALFGILIVVVIAAIGIVRFAGSAEGNLSQLGSGIADLFRGSERLELDIDDPIITSGEEAIIQLTHRNRSVSEDEGTYSFVVDCEDLTTAQINGEEVECDKESVLENTQEISIELVSDPDERLRDVPVTVYYRYEDVELSSELILTVENEEVENGTEDEDGGEEEETEDVTEEESSEEEGEQPTTEAPVFQGTPDLAVAVIDLGRIENGTFISDDRIDEDDRAAVRFMVSNGGSAATGPWTYNAILPTSEPELYNSGTQASLNPGDRLEFTLAFDNIDADSNSGRFYVNVDPLNKIKESSELNNFVRIEFES